MLVSEFLTYVQAFLSSAKEHALLRPRIRWRYWAKPAYKRSAWGLCPYSSAQSLVDFSLAGFAHGLETSQTINFHFHFLHKGETKSVWVWWRFSRINVHRTPIACRCNMFPWQHVSYGVVHSSTAEEPVLILRRGVGSDLTSLPWLYSFLIPPPYIGS